MKIELHIHTIGSNDSGIRLEDLKKYIKSKKIDCLFLSDHENSIPEKYLDDSKIKAGIEFKTDNGDLIGLFVNTRCDSNKTTDVIQHIHKLGGLVLIPHPFKYTKTNWDKYLKKIDLWEMHNPRLNREQNNLAVEYGLKHNLKMVVGSDAHSVEELGLTLVEMPEDGILTDEKIKKSFLSRNFTNIKTDYCPDSLMWQSKARRNLYLGNQFKYLYQTFFMCLSRLIEINSCYIIKNFNADETQKLLDKLYVYGQVWFWRFHHRQRIDAISKIINNLVKKDHMTALDLGCGRGIYASILAQKGFEVKGIDISPTELYFAKENFGSDVDFQVGDAQNIPFSDKSFDVVVCSEVIEHLNSHGKAMREIARVLKDNGKAIISMPNKCSLYWLRGMIILFCLKILGKNSTDLMQHTQWPFWKIDSLVSSANFRVINSSGTNLLFGFPSIFKIFVKYFSSIAVALTKFDYLLSRNRYLKYFNAFQIRLVKKKDRL